MPTDLASRAKAVSFEGFASIEDKEMFSRKLQEPLREEHIMGQFTEKKKMPKHHGKTMSFRKSMRIVPNKEKLSEGVLPDPNSFGILEYNTSLARYGDWIKYSDESEEYPIDDLQAAIVTEMGYAYKDLMEEKRTKIFESSKNHWFAGSTNTTDDTIANEGIDLNDLPKIAAFFARNNVQPVRDNCYVMIIPPEALIQLESLKKTADGESYTFIEIAKDMKSADVVYRGTEGKLLRFIFVVSNTIKTYNNGGENKTLAKCLILGKVKGKFPVEEVSLEGEGQPELINKPTSSGGVDNALNQVGSIGWKNHGWGGIVSNEEAVVVYHTLIAQTKDAGYDVWRDNNRIGAVEEIKFDSKRGETTSKKLSAETTEKPVNNGKDTGKAA